MRRTPFALLILLALAAGAVRAETHTVIVGDLFFEPAQLTIQAGDTVRWTTQNQMPTDVPHNVTSLNEPSFPSSPTTTTVEWSVTFDDPGAYDYLCTIHPGPMRGTVTVEATMEDPVFPINPGLNDAWFNPATDGQGFFINVFPLVETIFVGWFTFETEDRADPPPDADLGEPFHRWLTAIGPFSLDSNVATLDVFNTSGGVFDDPTAVTVSEAESYGTLVIEFEDCANAQVSYDLFAIGETGEIPIQRIVPDNNALCQALVDEINGDTTR